MPLSARSTRRLAATAGATFVLTLTLGPLATSAAADGGHDEHVWEPAETQPAATTAPGTVDETWGEPAHDHGDMADMTDEEMADHGDMTDMTDEEMANHGDMTDMTDEEMADHGDMTDMIDEEMANHGGTSHDEHGVDAAPESRPRAAVLGTFAGVNGAVMFGAAYLRRRDKATPRHRPRAATAASPRTEQTPPTAPKGA